MKRFSLFGFALAIVMGFSVSQADAFGTVSSSVADLDKTENCVMVYVKQDAREPNLTVACDGERILTHAVKTVDQLDNPSQFTTELFQAFQEMVNISGRKECKVYDLDTVWWASCLTN